MGAAGMPVINQRHLLSLQLRAGLGALATAAVGLGAACALASLCLSGIGGTAAAVTWLTAEAGFLVVWLRKKSTLDAIPDRHEPDGHDGMAAFMQWHQSSHYNAELLAIADLLAHWFSGVPMSDIRRGNAAELVARGYFYKSLDELAAEGKAGLVEEMLVAIEEVWGFRFADGLNPDIGYMHHLQEPLKASFRPLAFYVGCEAAAALKHVALLAAGFECRSYQAYTYYTYKLPSVTEEQAAQGCDASTGDLHPIVFLHGVGAGLLPYIPFLLRTIALGRPVMAVEYKHLAMRWTDFIPTAPQVAADMSHMLELHGIHKASLLAHSYGSFYVSCMLKLARHKVHAVGLIDPVACCMWSGNVINSFVYLRGLLNQGITGLVTGLIARDIHTAASVSRRFYWTDCNLWPSDVPDLTVMALSGKDVLVPVKHIEAMMRHEGPPGATVLLQPSFRHADFLFSPSWQDNILTHFAELVQRPPTPGGGGQAQEPAADVPAVTASLSSSLGSTSSLGSEPDTTITISAAARPKSKQWQEELPIAAARSDDAAELDQVHAASNRVQQDTASDAGSRSNSCSQLQDGAAAAAGKHKSRGSGGVTR